MGYAAGEARELPLRPTFDRRIKLEFHGARITSDGGLLAYRELDAALGLTEIALDRPGNCSPLAKCGAQPRKLCLRHLAPTHVPALSALPGVLERIKVAFGSRHPGNLGLRQIYLGDDAFVAQMKSRVDAADTLVDVPRQQRLPAPRPLATYEDEAGSRDDAMTAAYAGGHSLRAIARHFGVHESTVSRALRRRAATPSAPSSRGNA